MPDLFGPCRVAALEQWQTGTNRTGCDIEECYNESYECRWQLRAQDEFECTHISLFCSLADWSCNISDLLTDTRYDNHDFDHNAHQDILARYYTRLMMVIAEHLADLQYIAKEMGARTARQQISSPQDLKWVDNFHSFVNRVCKHKTGDNNIHHCNHHLPYCFGDMNNPCRFINPIQFSTVDLKSGDSIRYPKLAELIDGVLTAYSQVDQLLMADESKFNEMVKKFDDPNFT
jgi:hypothetical protein